MINPRSVNHGSVDSQSSKDQVSFLTQIMRFLHIREVFWDNGPTEIPNYSLISSGEVRHLISKMSSGLGCLLTGSQRLPRGRRKQRWLLIEAPRCFRSEGSVRGQIISGIIRLPLFPENLLFSFSLQVSERKGVLEIYLKISKKNVANLPVHSTCIVPCCTCSKKGALRLACVEPGV